VATNPSGKLAKPALAWYRKHQRDLPWRRTSDLYAIWISEIMLQQTQVATVIPYYDRFLTRFPNPTSLASAAEDEVYRLWAGLGYYRRARQLHAAAKKIVEEHAGLFPQQLEHVLSLPGIGRYTAHAILSFGLDARLGIVEANTQRLYARLLHWEGPVDSTEGQKAIWQYAGEIVPAKNCGEFNQAMMEIGSQICTPRNPRCDACPLLAFCPTGQRGDTDTIPSPKPKKSYTELTEAVVLIRNTSAQWLVRRCGKSERWAGLWDFPRFDVTRCTGSTEVVKFITQSIFEQFRIHVDLVDTKHSLRHAVTRYRIQLLSFLGELRADCHHAPAPENNVESSLWIDESELQDLAWNASAKRILKWLQESHLQGAKNHPQARRAPSSAKTPRNLGRRS
jgi:A/G-specific adenine glycosylase